MLSYVSLRLQADKDNSGKLDLQELQNAVADWFSAPDDEEDDPPPAIPPPDISVGVPVASAPAAAPAESPPASTCCVVS